MAQRAKTSLGSGLVRPDILSGHHAHFGLHTSCSKQNQATRFCLLFLFFINTSICFSEIHSARYVSLAPATTEILFALGLDEKIVGVSSYCNYPPEAKQKEKVGSFSAPNIEKILSLKPDIIFCTGMEQTPMVTELRHLHFKVYVSNPASIQELLDSILEIGRLTHKEPEAQKLTQDIKNRLQRIKESLQAEPVHKTRKVFVEIWGEPLITAGRGSFIDEVIYLAGGTNIAHDVPRSFCYFSTEQVLKRNPDCILLTYMSAELPQEIIKKRFGWDKIAAVKNKCVYNDINPDLLLRPGPRIAQGVQELYNRLHSLQ